MQQARSFHFSPQLTRRVSPWQRSAGDGERCRVESGRAVRGSSRTASWYCLQLGRCNASAGGNAEDRIVYISIRGNDLAGSLQDGNWTSIRASTGPGEVTFAPVVVVDAPSFMGLERYGLSASAEYCISQTKAEQGRAEAEACLQWAARHPRALLKSSPRMSSSNVRLQRAPSREA